MITLSEVTLFFTDSGSDKFYHISLVDNDGSYTVPFDYGRRGQAGQYGKKVEGVPYEKALKAFQSVLKEKVGKGYTTHEDGTPFAGAALPEVGVPGAAPAKAKDTKRSATVKKPPALTQGNEGYGPQLLNPITEEEAEAYLEDDRYGAQEKHNGKRLTLRYKSGDLQAYNKKNQPVGCDAYYAGAMERMGVSELIVSGEAIGKHFYIYDILSQDGRDLRGLSYVERYRIMESLPVKGNPVYRVSLLVVGVELKGLLFSNLKREKREGIVFKLLSGVHKENRPNKGGDHLKCKFWASASCRVMRLNDKSSIGLGLLDGDKWVDVGNCTVTKNAKYPVDSVVEIKYLYAHEGGSLYQPSCLGIRDDVDLDECVLGQLKYRPED